MNHVNCHQFVQPRVRNRTWNLGADYVIDGLDCVEFVLFLKNDEHVSMWQAAFLIFNDVDVGNRTTYFWNKTLLFNI